MQQCRQSHQAGFTMLEIMVVLVIVGLFITVGGRRLVNPGTEMKAQVRRFSTIVKKLRNRARLDNKTYRLVFDLPIDQDKQQSYWVEGTSKSALLLSEEQREDLEDDIEEVETKDGKKVTPDPQGFVPDSSVVKQAPATLPRGLYFESIEIDGDPIEKVSEGRVYIYFFPQGYVQNSAIHLSNRDSLNWTLVIQGLTGRVGMHSRYRSLEEFKEE
jgi:general secretion pathway protein H